MRRVRRRDAHLGRLRFVRSGWLEIWISRRPERVNSTLILRAFSRSGTTRFSLLDSDRSLAGQLWSALNGSSAMYSSVAVPKNSPR